MKRKLRAIGVQQMFQSDGDQHCVGIERMAVFGQRVPGLLLA
jgi:hypothetical protein